MTASERRLTKWFSLFPFFSHTFGQGKIPVTYAPSPNVISAFAVTEQCLIPLSIIRRILQMGFLVSASDSV